MLDGLISNEYVVKDWETYFAVSTLKQEESFNEAKNRWCRRNFADWIDNTKDFVEAPNVLKEVRLQEQGPTTRLCLEKYRLK